MYWINLNVVNSSCFNPFLQTSLGYYGAFLYHQRTVDSMWDLNETFEQIEYFVLKGTLNTDLVWTIPASNRYNLLQFLMNTAVIVSEDGAIHQSGNTKALQLFRKAEAKLLVFSIPGDYGNYKLYVLFLLEYGLFYSPSQNRVWYWYAWWCLTRIWLLFKI